MTGDECDSPTCGTCHIESCDVCGRPVAFVDDEGEAWCLACHRDDKAQRDEAVWLRQWEVSQ